MERTAVIFLDGDVMKVVFGRTVKELPASEVKSERAFFERLFKDYRVVVVERAVEASLGQIMDERPAQAKEGAGDEPPDGSPKNPPFSSGPEAWIRSTSRTTIVIDDLPTGVELSPGVPMMFSVPHDRAVKLSTANPDAIDKSVILKRLLANGTLEWISAPEAAAMEAEHASKVAQENDERLNQWAPIIDGVSAVDYAADPNRRFVSSEKFDPDPVDVDADEPSEQEEIASMVPAEKERPEPEAKRPVSNPVARHTMAELMNQISEAEKEGLMKPVARRKVTNASSSDGSKAKGISKIR